jgi:hypothetical protein
MKRLRKRILFNSHFESLAETANKMGKELFAYLAIAASVAGLTSLSELVYLQVLPNYDQEAAALCTGAVVGMYWPIFMPAYTAVVLNRMRVMFTGQPKPRED